MSEVPSFRRIVKRPHRTYVLEDIEDILVYLKTPVIPYGALSKISVSTGIPKQTLCDWKHRIFASDEAIANYGTNRNIKKRIFPPIVEERIAENLVDNFINPGIGATTHNIRDLAFNAYAFLAPHQTRATRFAASQSWVNGFLKRNNLSYRSPHAERRNKVNEVYVDQFFNTLEEIKRNIEPHLILNIDETCWLLINKPNKVIGVKAAETVKLVKKAMKKHR